jgi:hypothetical protein
MVITHGHILLLGLLLASSTVARAAQTGQGTAPVPRFEPASCPKLPGAEELAKASCGYLVVPENRDRPTGRTIKLMVAKYPGRRLRAGPLTAGRSSKTKRPGGWPRLAWGLRPSRSAA